MKLEMGGTDNETKTLKRDNPTKEKETTVVFEDISDEVLEELRNGSHEAFQTIYNLYYKHIYAYSKAMTKSDVEAEDITQNALIQLWEKRAEIAPGTIMRRYLFTAARYLVFNYFRKLKINDKYFELANRVSEGDSTSEQQFMAEEEARHLRLIVARMPKLRRQVFEMSEKERLTNEQIAKKLKISVNTVASHLYNARKELQEVHKTLSVVLLFFLSN